MKTRFWDPHTGALSREAKGLAIFLLFFVLLLAAYAFLIWRRHDVPPFVYTEHLDDVILTVDDEEITLRSFGYYVFEVEGYVQRQALLYDETDPHQYWITHYAAGMDSTFMYDYALNTALDTCIRDTVYAHLARQHGMRPGAADEKKTEENAALFFKNMNEAQLAVTGLSAELILDTEKKRMLGSLYVKDFAARTNLSGYGGTPAQVLSYDGRYYREHILPEHTVIYNEALIDQIRFGCITVNMEDRL